MLQFCPQLQWYSQSPPPNSNILNITPLSPFTIDSTVCWFHPSGSSMLPGLFSTTIIFSVPTPQFQLPQPNLTKSIYCWTNCLLVPPIRLLDASVLNNNNSLNPHPQFQLPQPNYGPTMSCPRSGKLLFSYRQWYWNVLELQLSDFEMYWNVLEFQNFAVLEKRNCTGKCI